MALIVDNISLLCVYFLINFVCEQRVRTYTVSLQQKSNLICLILKNKRIMEYEEDDYYSPTDWEREYGESDEDYAERLQDLEDWMEYFDD